MKRWQRWTFGALALAVSFTGILYFWMKYLLVTGDPFAVVNHPWQPMVLAAHVLAAPGLLLMFGIILESHVLRKLRAPGIPNRRSGLLSFSTFFIMTVSGYLLQVVTSEPLLVAVRVAHIGSGAIFAVAYAVHLIISVRLARRAPGPLLAKSA